MKYFPFLILTILFACSAGFSQTADSAKSIAGHDTTATGDSLSAASEPDSSGVNVLPLHPKISPWDWKYSASLRGVSTFSITAPNEAEKFKYMPPEYHSGKQSALDPSGFQGSTAFSLSYSEELRRKDQLKPEYGNAYFVVPVLPMAFLALYGAKEGFLALKKDPPISFDETDLTLLKMMWADPDLMAVDYYRKYNQQDLPANLTYMSLQQRLDKLLSQRVIESRKGGDNKARYSVRHNRQELLEVLDEELRKDNGEQPPARLLELQRMKMLLLNGK